jgi:nucleoid-associated protein YgaU
MAEGGRIFRDALRLVHSSDKNSPSIAAALEMVKAAMLPERYMALLQAEADAKPEPQKAEEVQPKESEPQKAETQKTEPTKAVTETAK